MVVGLYGLLYLEVARVPERGWLLAAVGLLGKVLGPIGLVSLDLEWRVAAFNADPIHHERFCLVGTVLNLSLRRLAFLSAGF